MKATAKLLATALAAAGLMAAAGAQAAGHGGVHAGVAHGSWGGWHGGYARPAAVYHGGYYHGGYRGWYGPRLGFYFGVPIAFGPWWGYDPYWYGYYGPRETVVYRDVVTEPAFVDAPAQGGEATLMPPGGEPAAAPPAANPLGMHYCVSARAYYPTVKVCPEGWAVKPPTQ